MIKRETIKQAIDAIRRRDSEIGYALDEMLGMGMIDAPAPGQDVMLGDDFYFLFNAYKARVSRFLYINKGNIPIEERLLIKYGELQKKRELIEKGEAVDTPEAARVIRKAGLRLMVVHEIDYAIERIKKQLEKPGDSMSLPVEIPPPAPDAVESPFLPDTGIERYNRLILFLESLKQDPKELKLDPVGSHPGVFYCGSIGKDTPAAFMRFPYCLDSLLQVADINIEFFHVRFFLNRLILNQWRHLYACVASNKVIGLLYLTLRERFLLKSLEIKFIAAARSIPTQNTMQPVPPPRGVGTFLVAGAWLQWKTFLPQAKQMLLDSEIGARHFYDSMGFSSRGMSEFILRNPRGFLLKAIVTLANSAPNVTSQIYHEISVLLRKKIKSLRKKPEIAKDIAERSAIIGAFKEFFKTQHSTESGKILLQLLCKYKKEMPESTELINAACGYRKAQTQKDAKHDPGPDYQR